MEEDPLKPQMTIGANDEAKPVKKTNNIPAILMGLMLIGALYQLVGTHFLPKKQANTPQANVQSDCSAINAPQTSRELTKHGLRPTIDNTDAKPSC